MAFITPSTRSASRTAATSCVTSVGVDRIGTTWDRVRVQFSNVHMGELVPNEPFPMHFIVHLHDSWDASRARPTTSARSSCWAKWPPGLPGASSSGGPDEDDRVSADDVSVDSLTHPEHLGLSGLQVRGDGVHGYAKRITTAREQGARLQQR